MPNRAEREKSVNASGSPEIELPLVISRPMPLSAVSVASVMMKGGRPSLMMPNAWNTPIRLPTARVIRIASTIGTFACSSSATTTPEKPITAPIDRSMPAVMMTKVWPIAMIASTDACRIRLTRLLAVRKVRVLSDSAIHSSSSRPSRVRFSSRFRRVCWRRLAAKASSLTRLSLKRRWLGSGWSPPAHHENRRSRPAHRGETRAACPPTRRLPAGRTRSG